jgi:hypothetical protein
LSPSPLTAAVQPIDASLKFTHRSAPNTKAHKARAGITAHIFAERVDHPQHNQYGRPGGIFCRFCNAIISVARFCRRCNRAGVAVFYWVMKRRFGALVALVLLAALGSGCNSSGASLNLYIVDALSGQAMENVRVEHRPAKEGVVSILTSDSSGHVDGMTVHRNDTLSFSKAGYKPLRALISFGIALPNGMAGVPLQSVPPPGDDDAARKADVPINDADALPISPEHLMTVLMHPK